MSESEFMQATSDGFITRWRWAILACWIIAVVLLVVLVPPGDPAAFEASNFLPAETPYSQALEIFQKQFPASGALSEVVVIFERKHGGMSPQDLEAIREFAQQVQQPTAQTPQEILAGIHVLSPADIPPPLQPNPLVSPLSSLGQAALVRVSVPSNFITIRSSRIVEHVRGLLERKQLPEGLRVAVTGSSGFGHDYAAAAELSHRHTVYVTIISVALILLLVYRAPLAALVPLLAISVAAIVAIKLLSFGERFGLHVGTAESIFVVVLIYGAGVDYSLLLISRFREFVDHRLGAPQAADRSVAAALAAILAAAATNILGLLMLRFAAYRIFQTTGPAVAVALCVALLASLTLVPALLAVMGRRVFWPRLKRLEERPRRLWPAVGRMVTTWPLLVLIITLLAMAYPIFRGANQTWVYDTLATVPASYSQNIGNAAAGLEIARRHWPVGEIAPVKVLVQSPAALDADQWRSVSAQITSALQKLKSPDFPGQLPVANVRSLSQPLGKGYSVDGNLLLGPLVRLMVRSTYLSADGKAMRLDVLMSTPALELRTMQEVQHLRQVVQEVSTQALTKELRQSNLPPSVYLAGATAEMVETRQVTQKDFRLIIILVLSVIFAIMLVLLREPLLSLFMVLSTVGSYFATLGLCHWLLVSLPPLLGLAGYSGLDWKVEIFLFVVMVAVGQDYNIFLAGRLMQEARLLPPRQAALQAVIHTGPVISSAGLIMAATLGSLMAGHLALLVQLGFALSLGMLIDTFVVRPLLVPAFAALTGKTGKPWGATNHLAH